MTFITNVRCKDVSALLFDKVDKMVKNVFFVRSDFQYLFCKSLIHYKGIEKQYCYFACDRGVKVDDGFSECFLYQNGYNRSFVKRILFYFYNRKKIVTFEKGCRIVRYLPFSLKYPRYYGDEIVFFEEGFSAYSNCRVLYNKRLHISETIKHILISLLFPFADIFIKSYLLGDNYSGTKPFYKTSIYTCSNMSYRNIDNPLIVKYVIPFNSFSVGQMEYYIPNGSYVLVLDRFSPFGRPFDIDNYIKCIRYIIDDIQKKDVDKIWVKFHPSDFNNNVSRDLFWEIVKESSMKVELFDGRLEYLAIQNICIHFVGTISTALYYAPILGNTNASLSYAKVLASMDKKYSDFAANWGANEAYSSKVTYVERI